MLENRPFIRSAIATSLGAGLLAVLLLGRTWGFGAAIFAVLAILAIFGLQNQGSLQTSKLSKAALILAAVFAVLPIWRDAEELRFLNGLCAFLLVGLACVAARYEAKRAPNLADVTGGVIAQWGLILTDGVRLLIQDSKTTEAADPGNDEVAGAARSLRGNGPTANQNGRLVARALAVSTPLVLIFGGLLYSADASFERFVRSIFNFDITLVGQDSTIFLAAAIGIAGLARRLYLSQTPIPKPPVIPPDHVAALKPIRLAPLETLIILGVLNALFLTFVLVELPYLFGGISHIFSTPNLTTADYARRGFFELVAVVALGIPTLLLLFKLTPTESIATRTTMRVLAVSMVAMLGVVLFSAAQRMGIYVDLFGLSRLRIYVGAAMAWMLLVLAWFVATTLRGRPQKFGIGCAAAFLVVTVGLNVLSPDAQVAAFNTTPTRLRRIDPIYLATLSADATPTLEAALPRLPNDAANAIRSSRDSLRKDAGADWRDQNLSRLSAR